MEAIKCDFCDNDAIDEFEIGFEDYAWLCSECLKEFEGDEKDG